MNVSINLNKQSLSTLFVVFVLLISTIMMASAAYNVFTAEGSMVVDEAKFTVTEIDEGDGYIGDFVDTEVDPNDTFVFGFEVTNNHDNPIDVTLKCTVSPNDLEGKWRDNSNKTLTDTLIKNETKEYVLDLVVPNDVAPGTHTIKVTIDRS